MDSIELLMNEYKNIKRVLLIIRERTALGEEVEAGPIARMLNELY